MCQISALDACCHLDESKDYEVKVAFLQLAISAKCRDFMQADEKKKEKILAKVFA